jgi:hypothetical protein
MKTGGRVLGFLVFIGTLLSIFSGTTFGLGNLAQNTRFVNFSESPVEFIITVGVQFLLCYFLLRTPNDVQE